MLRRSLRPLARISNTNATHGQNKFVRPSKIQAHNDQIIEQKSQTDSVKRSLTMLGTSAEDMARLSDGLPGVQFASELPADPITRLFFQVKGHNALYQSSYLDDKNRDKVGNKPRTGSDGDRVSLGVRPFLVVHDFSGRVMEAAAKRKRFVIVPSTSETRGIAIIMQSHGLIAGTRDFNNNRAFVIEMKYFQGDSVITRMNAVRVAPTQGETEWSPLMMRRFLNKHGRSAKVEIAIVRGHDGRILDQYQCIQEHIGGTGLIVVA